MAYPRGEAKPVEDRKPAQHQTHHVRGEIKPADKPNGGTRKLAAGKKLKYRDLGGYQCVDFHLNQYWEQCDFVPCSSTKTTFEKKRSDRMGKKIYKILTGHQARKCLDSWANGAYPCDQTTWQDWKVRVVAGTR